MTKWVLLDDDNNPIRYFSYPAVGSVKIKEPEYKIDWNNYEECLF